MLSHSKEEVYHLAVQAKPVNRHQRNPQLPLNHTVPPQVKADLR